MAILKNLIVNGGASRFIGTSYFQDVSIAGSANFATISASGDITAGGNLKSTTGNLYLKNLLAINGQTDNWLRINANNAFSSGTYFGNNIVRTDGTFQVGANGAAVNIYYANNNTNKAMTVGIPATFNDALVATSTANLATVNATNVNVTNNLRANHYDLQTVAQLGGSFYISPTVKFPNSGTSLTVAKSGTTLTLTITDSSITSTTMAGVVWTTGSGVKVSGTINGVVTGTMDGTISSINTSSHVLTLSVSGENSANVVAGTYTASQFKDLSVMLYTRKQDGTSKMINTASGAIASFTDGGNNVPVKQLVVDIEPVQDLHGQANPYPAGGGKNLLNYNTATVTENSVSFNTGITLEANQPYTFTYYGNDTVNIIGYTHDTSTRIFTSGYVKTYTFTPGETVNIDINYYSSSGVASAENLFQAEKGSSSSSFAPYSNICPITGHTSAVVTRTRKNVIPSDITWKRNNSGNFIPATADDSTTRIRTSTFAIKYGTYKISGIPSGSSVLSVRMFDASKTRIEPDISAPNNVITLGSNVAYIHILFGGSNYGSTTASTFASLQLEVGTTATAYESPNVATYTIDLGGTRYGGTLNVETGVLTVDRQILDLGSIGWSRLSTNIENKYRFGTSAVASEIKRPSTYMITGEILCSCFGEVRGDDPINNVTGIGVHTNGNIIAYSEKYATYTDTQFKTAMSGQTLVYTLATPFTVQLPHTEVRTLSGYNNIWSNTGDTNLIYETSQYDTTSNYNVGIWMNCYDQANSSSTIRVYNGSSRWPNVFLGNMTNADLPRVNGNEPYGYGLYSDNVFLRGIISATGGLIGNWTIGTTGMFYNSDAPGSTSITMIPGGTAASTTSIGGSSGSKSWIFTGKNLFGIDTTGKLYASSAVISGDITATSGTIGGVTANNSYGLYTNNKTSATSTNTGFLISKDGAIYLGAYNSTNQACPFQVTNAGFLTATSGKIGGWNIGISSLYSGTHSAYNSNVDGIFMDSTYIAGGKQAVWYLKNDGSAKIGAMTLSSDGTLAVPAANITGSFSVGKIDGLSDSLSNIENTANAALGQSVWYATCETAAATAAKIATITPATTEFTLKAGATVNVTFQYTNSNTTTITLNVNETGAKNIKYINNNSITNIPGVGYILANRTYQFVYDGTYWVIQNLNTYTDTINRTKYDIVIRANGSITASHIICGTSNGYKDIGGGVSFDLSYPLLYAATGLSTGGTGSNNFLQINDINASNNGTIVGGAAYKTLYLKGKVSNNTFTISSSEYLTATPPSNIDNLYYIPLGTFKSGSTTNIYFNSSSRLHAYINGAFQPVDMAVRRYITDISSGGIKVSYATDPINYLQIVPSGINIFKNNNQIASYGSSIILGELADGKTHVEIDSDSFDVCFGATTGANSTKLATFGATTTIGNTSNKHIIINDTSFSFNDGDNTQMQIDASGFHFGEEDQTGDLVDDIQFSVSQSGILFQNKIFDEYYKPEVFNVSIADTELRQYAVTRQYQYTRGDMEFNEDKANIYELGTFLKGVTPQFYLSYYKTNSDQSFTVENTELLDSSYYTWGFDEVYEDTDPESPEYGYKGPRAWVIFNSTGITAINNKLSAYCTAHSWPGNTGFYDIHFNVTTKDPPSANLDMYGNVNVKSRVYIEGFETREEGGNITCREIANQDGTTLGAISHIGSIIMSTTLDTEAKVIAVYGGSHWIRHSGYFLRGASSGVSQDSAVTDGGSDSVKLTAAQSGVGSHHHGTGDNSYKYWTVLTGGASQETIGSISGTGYKIQQVSSNYNYGTRAATSDTSAGASSAHTNLPRYKNVYIWERIY